MLVSDQIKVEVKDKHYKHHSTTNIHTSYGVMQYYLKGKKSKARLHTIEGKA